MAKSGRVSSGFWLIADVRWFLSKNPCQGGPAEPTLPVRPFFVRWLPQTKQQLGSLLLRCKGDTVAVVPEVLGVSIYAWFLLVAPPLLLMLVLALLRTRVWLLIAAFSWSAAGTALAECLYDILAAKRFDQKFQHAPEVALELSLLGAGCIVLIGLAVFGLALAGKKQLRERIPVYLAAVLGGLFTTVPWLLLR
jgi:hypothetical protein